MSAAQRKSVAELQDYARALEDLQALRAQSRNQHHALGQALYEEHCVAFFEKHLSKTEAALKEAVGSIKV